MKRVLVRYRVKPGRAAENEALIAKVFEQLAREQPLGLRYASFKLEDGVSFVHIMEAEPGRDVLGTLNAFKAFVGQIRERCENPPLGLACTPVGSYRFLADPG